MFYLPTFDICLFFTMLNAYDVFIDGPTLLPEHNAEAHMIVWGIFVGFQVVSTVYKYMGY
jgi:hypothetical protein